MLLATFKADWSDEFDVYGFKLFTNDQWKKYQDLIKDETGLSFYFGTNEGWDEDGQFYLDHITTRKVTEQEAKVIVEIFGEEYGVFPHFEDQFEEEE